MADTFGSKLARVYATFEDLRPIMPEIAEIIDSSVQENFMVGGRFGNANEMGGGTNRWNVSQRARRQHGQTLVDTGRMRASFQVTITDDGIAIGSNVRYAAAQHYGVDIDHPGGTPFAMIGGIPTFLKKDGNYPPGTRFTKAHKIPLEARPWAVVQNEDLEDINEVVVDHFRANS